ncbi:hypothetical protein B0T16DRAFT_462404 [Cercophora newfieldiana]|uniref:F-box domain-containing protein n=1 Tax=Cercophora newfieldiana TaxID=92897 RepID=A0AA39XR22_9PEZI|nr:hypothetical protein B0T16DRAFT_462404 [Cercophora newfieldiana]
MSTPQAQGVSPSPSVGSRDPPRLCGRQVHIDHDQGDIFWEAVGPIAKTWTSLGPRINARVLQRAGKDVAFSIHMFMAGKSVQTAAPRVLFCLDDEEIQQILRADRALNEGLRSFRPPIEIGFWNNLPEMLGGDALSTDQMQYGSLASSASPYGVWAADVEPVLGSRLYVACRDGGPPRMATAGPVFSYGGRFFQTTARHVFYGQKQSSGQAGAPKDIASSHSPKVCHESTTLQYDGESQDLCLGKGKEPEIPRDAFYIGEALVRTTDEAQHTTDCALIEVCASNTVDPNLVSYDPSDSSKKLRVTRPADMAKLRPGAAVIVATSSGPVCGTLLTTLAYIKSESERHSVAVYPVMLDAQMELSPGDCGSLVVLLRGEEVHMLGHILFGHPNIAFAYFLPINNIVEHMAAVLTPLIPDEKVSLQLGSCPQDTPTHSGRTEFASPRFYKDLEESVMPKTRRVRGMLGKLVDKLGYTRAMIKMSGEKHEETPRVTLSSFEELFFGKLPPELRDQVIDYLTFREAMNLRHVSTKFRAAVSMNGRAISRRFLVKNPLPPLAQSLYPHPSPDLNHIHMVGHCHAVAWRLADHIVQWLRRDMFLYGSRFQKQQFQPKKVRMKQRLLPSLLLLGRFFETCRGCLEEWAREEIGAGNVSQEITFKFERHIISSCSDELLLQTQDVALILVTYLRRAMRPSSKYGTVERTLRHGSVKPLPDAEIAAVICYGGLEAMVDILDLEGLDKKVAAVRDYCAPLTQPTQAMSRWAPWRSKDTSHGSLARSNGNTSVGAETKSSRTIDLHGLLPHLPKMDDIWRPMAQAVLVERGVVKGSRDLNSFEVALKELIRESETRADVLYMNGHDLWHALSDSEQRQRSR